VICDRGNTDLISVILCYSTMKNELPDRKSGEEPEADIEVDEEKKVGAADIRVDEDGGIGAPDIRP